MPARSRLLAPPFALLLGLAQLMLDFGHQLPRRAQLAFSL